MQQQPPNSEPVYVISVAARLAGLPCWVLRVLDQEEIVVPARTDSNRRLYSDQDIAILARVRHWTEERGVNIAGVKVILELELGVKGKMNGNDYPPRDEAGVGRILTDDQPESREELNGGGTSLALAGRGSLARYDSSK